MASALLAWVLFSHSASAQTPQATVTVTLDQAIEMALQHNHTLLAARTTVPQSEAQEVTANLRPNPTLFTDWEYLPLVHPSGNIPDYLHDSTEGDIGLSYLFERGKKRQHRLKAAKDATAVTRSQVRDNERNLAFQVGQLFINVQLAQSTLDLAEQDLESFSKTVDIGEKQFKAGGISENDYLKIKLQLLQFQQDVQQARLAKVEALSDLRQLLGYESVPGDYDVAGAFDYQPLTVALGDLQAKALDNRPDLKAAIESVDKAQTDYKLAQANGSTDPTVSFDVGRNPPIDFYFGLDVSIPLRIFDRNQGEKLRTKLDITRNEKLRDAAEAQVFNDVDSAYATLNSNLILLRPYKQKYLAQAVRVRDTILFSYQHGGASLLDFINAETEYRTVQLSYVNLVGSYLTSAAQLNQAVGREVLHE